MFKSPTLLRSRIVIALAIASFLPFSPTCAQQGVLKVEAAPTKPEVVRFREAPHPRKAKRLNHDGFAQVLYMVDEKGKPFAPVVLRSTGEEFEKSALKRVLSNKLKPATLAGSPVPSTMMQTIYFSSIQPEQKLSPKLERLFALAESQLSTPLANQEDIAATIDEIESARFLRGDALLELQRVKADFAAHFGSLAEQIDELDKLMFLTHAHQEMVVEGQAPTQGWHLPFYISTPVAHIYTKASEDLFKRSLETYLAAGRITEAHLVYQNYLVNHKSPSQPMIDLNKQVSPFWAWNKSISTPLDFSMRGYDLIRLPKQGFLFYLAEGSPEPEAIILRCEYAYQEFEYKKGKRYFAPETSGMCWLQVNADPTAIMSAYFFDMPSPNQFRRWTD